MVQLIERSQKESNGVRGPDDKDKSWADSVKDKSHDKSTDWEKEKETSEKPDT
jgi:hypothetical protein